MNQDKLGELKERIILHRLLSISVGALAVFLMAFTLIPTLISEASASSSVSLSAAWNAVSLTFDPDIAATAAGGSISDLGHGDINFGDIVPTSADTTSGNLGTQKVVKKTLGITTEGQYYSVYLSMLGDNNSLVLSNSGVAIESTTGTWSHPTSFTASSWGYAVPTGNALDDTFITPFSSPAVYSNYDSTIGQDLTKTGTGSSVYNTGTWAAVPVASSSSPAPQQIWKAETTNSYGFGGEHGDKVKDHFDIYYSALIDTNVMAGSYENQIVYTALAASSSLDTASTNLARSLEYVTTGSSETLSFDLSASTAAITQSQVEVYLIPHYLVERNNYTLSNDYNAYKVTNNECTVTSLTLTSAGATTNCTLPASPNGIDDGVTTEDTVTYEDPDPEGEEGDTITTTVTIQKGEFDLLLTIDDYGYNYISRYTKELDPVASIVYAGLQSKNENGQTYITQMQEMSGAICKNTNKWGSTTGLDARIYNYNGEQKETTTETVTDPETGKETEQEVITRNGTPLKSTALESDALTIGTFALKDNRDQKDYLVRRLADDNCWMVQNLDLELADFVGKDNTNGGLTPENTDLDSSRTYWDPSEIAANRAYNIDPTIDKNDQSSYFSVYATHYLGLNQSKQFLSYNLLYALGTKCDAIDDCNRSDERSSNLSAVPRSYSNMVTDNQTTDFSHAIQFRYIATNWQTGYSRNQSADDEAPTAFGKTPSTLITATEDYIPAERAKAETGSAGASYEANATGTYYGNMYIGHYYNFTAASAETFITKTGNYSQSICPSGWRIPRHEAVSGFLENFKSLLNSYGIVNTSGTATTEETLALRRLPLSLAFTGSGPTVFTWSNGINNRGSLVYLHNAHIYADRARVFRASSTGIRSDASNEGNWSAASSYAIRCVARN